MADDRPEIPFIVTTADDDREIPVTSPTPPQRGQHALNLPPIITSPSHRILHHRSPSDPAYLSPSLPPASPYPPSSDADSTAVSAPPSPALTARSSVHFAPATALNLRENRPEDKDGLSSMGLLNASNSNSNSGHARRGSTATFQSGVSDGATIADTSSEYAGYTQSQSHSPLLSPSPSSSGSHRRDNNNNTTQDKDHLTVTIGLSPLSSRRGSTSGSGEHSPTVTHVDSASAEEGGRGRGKGKEVDLGEGEEETHTLVASDKGSHKNHKTKRSSSSNHADPDADPPPTPHLPPTTDDPVDPTPFKFKPYELASLVDPKNLAQLTSMGGVVGLLEGLASDRRRGLDLSSGGGGGSGGGGEVPELRVTSPAGENSDEFKDTRGEGGPRGATVGDRKRVYGSNVLPQRKSKGLLVLMWLAMKDKVLILLSIAAVVSLALGFFQDFGTPRPPGEPPVDWVEGVAIIVAILIVVIVGSLNDWQKERQFKSLNEKKEERGVKVIRGGVERVIDVKEVLVGDVALLEPGEIVPCDGVFLDGHNVKCDESGATGESDAIKKVGYEEAVRLGEEAKHADCFVVSGSKVLEGVGRYVIIAVGEKSFNGRIMMALRGDAENTPLQLKLNALAELIAKAGSAAGLLLFTALMIRFFVQLGTNNPDRTANEKGIAFVQILIISVTLVVVAVPEGLPLAVTLALAFATKRMTKEKLLVRVLGSCETMANASVVCTDKTGTLTQNVMSVVAGSIGIHAKFVRNLEENGARTNADEASDRQQERRHPEDFSIDQSQVNGVLSPQLQELFNDAIAVNSTAFEDENPENGEMMFVGSKTETALLKFAQELKWNKYNEVREAADIVQMIPFSSERKAMGVVMRLKNGKYRLLLKGASEILSGKCVRHVAVRKDAGQESGSEVETAEITDLARDNISRTTIFYANQMLRTIALCYRDLESWPPAGSSTNSEDEVPYEELARDLVLIGIVGIEDPLRDGVRQAVADCHMAGVTVKMCTGDNVLTARSIALQCGIYTAGGIIMEGPVFRQLDDKEMLEVVPRLQVLARSSPEDKKILVEKLKALGEIVGVTGDGTNDGPALKTAHVGFSMGIAGTEVAKEASDIILMDDNFSSIVKAIMWGRCVNDAVRKFLQFQISANITAVLITFVSAVASSEEESVLSAVQLLWINIIMDTFAALALATDPASPALLDRKPESKTAPLFSVDMYKQIIAQSAYQTTITLIFHFLGKQILGTTDDDIVQTIVFNIFVFAQIFNSVNSRRLDRKWNVFEGVFRNYYFIGITLIEIGAQILIVFVGGAAFQVTPLPGREWGISIALGCVALLIGALVRCIPNGPVERFFIWIHLLPNPEVLPTVNPESEWNAAIQMVRDNLGTFANLRGGRLRGSSFVAKSRKAQLDESNATTVPSLLTMVPTLIASSVGAGWAPQSGSLSDPAHNDPSKSTAALWEGKMQVHPDTKPDDPIYQKWGLPRP